MRGRRTPQALTPLSPATRWLMAARTAGWKNYPGSGQASASTTRAATETRAVANAWSSMARAIQSAIAQRLSAVAPRHTTVARGCGAAGRTTALFRSKSRSAAQLASRAGRDINCRWLDVLVSFARRRLTPAARAHARNSDQGRALACAGLRSGTRPSTANMDSVWRPTVSHDDLDLLSHPTCRSVFRERSVFSEGCSLSCGRDRRALLVRRRLRANCTTVLPEFPRRCPLFAAVPERRAAHLS